MNLKSSKSSFMKEKCNSKCNDNAEFDSKNFIYNVLHDYHLACEISTVRTLALKLDFVNPAVFLVVTLYKQYFEKLFILKNPHFVCPII